MKTLIWKEFRQNRRLHIASLIFVLIPYLCVLSAALIEYLHRGTIWKPMDWAQLVETASGGSLFISVLSCAFLAGNAVAGERADRSAEFVSYIPIPRTTALASKLLVASIGALFLTFSNGMIFLLSVSYQNANIRPVGSNGVLTLFAVTAAFLFGVSWLLSNLLRTPSIAAGGALAGLVSYFVATLLLEELYPAVVFDELYVITGLSLGLMCFCGGTLGFLRRVEP